MKKTKKEDGRSTRTSKAHRELASKFKKLKSNAKRNLVKNASLNKKYHNLTVHEYIDYDYLNLLSEEDKAWLNKFTEEEYRAYFRKDGSKSLHKKKDRKKVYDTNNARNRDILSRSKKERNVEYLSPIEASQLTNKSHFRDIEEAMVEAIDYSRLVESEEED